jgi:hypothetical protein
MEDRLIQATIAASWRNIVESISEYLTGIGSKVAMKGEGMDCLLRIEKGEKKIDFLLANTLLEIATIDRDDKPLRFDRKLLDGEYGNRKTIEVVQSKLAVLLPLIIDDDDGEVAIEKVKNLKGYERIIILQIDPKDKKGLANDNQPFGN